MARLTLIPPIAFRSPVATERLLLREFRLEDEAAIHAYASDLEVTRFTTWGPNTADATHDILHSWLADRENWPRATVPVAIELRADGTLIGGTGFAPLDLERRTGTFGYVLHRNYWGRGFATEAARGLIQCGFTELNLHRVVAECIVENIASMRVLEKLGMRREGHFRKNLLKAGQWRDTYLYALLREEWRR
jgi:[ribosomal protein S5]-alanine N-acetyltransferase